MRFGSRRGHGVAGVTCSANSGEPTRWLMARQAGQRCERRRTNYFFRLRTMSSTYFANSRTIARPAQEPWPSLPLQLFPFDVDQSLAPDTRSVTVASNAAPSTSSVPNSLIAFTASGSRPTDITRSASSRCATCLSRLQACNSMPTASRSSSGPSRLTKIVFAEGEQLRVFRLLLLAPRGAGHDGTRSSGVRPRTGQVPAHKRSSRCGSRPLPNGPSVPPGDAVRKPRRVGPPAGGAPAGGCQPSLEMSPPLPRWKCPLTWLTMRGLWKCGNLARWREASKAGDARPRSVHAAGISTAGFRTVVPRASGRASRRGRRAAPRGACAHSASERARPGMGLPLPARRPLSPPPPPRSGWRDPRGIGADDAGATAPGASGPVPACGRGGAAPCKSAGAPPTCPGLWPGRCGAAQRRGQRKGPLERK